MDYRFRFFVIQRRTRVSVRLQNGLQILESCNLILGGVVLHSWMGSRRSFGLVMVRGHMVMTTQRPDDAEPLHLMILPQGPIMSCQGLMIFTQRLDNTRSLTSHFRIAVLALDRLKMLRLCYGNVKVL